MRRLSVCIPTWERVEMVIEAFEKVYDDPRISEVVIVDDASSIEVFQRLKAIVDCMPKVKLFRNEVNLDCYENKKTTVSYATNEFVILLDSDNVIDKSYINKIFEYEWRPEIILTPDFAKPHFNFTTYSGVLLTKENISEYIDKPMLETLLNAANYFVNRGEYLKAFDDTIDPVTSDSFYITYRWLSIGNKIQVVDGLRYIHRVHEGSHYRNNNKRTPIGFHDIVLQKMRELK